MATTKRTQTRIAQVVHKSPQLALAVGAACGAAYLINRGVRWYWNREKERAVEEEIVEFGSHETSLQDELEPLSQTGPDCQDGDHHVRGWRRIRPHVAQQLAYGLADEAYFHFGKREKSKANDLVTRKFLRDQLSEFGSMRAKDKSAVVDLALPLSYVPPVLPAVYDDMVNTYAYQRRVPVAKDARR